MALSAKDFNKGAITSADQLIAGKAAGVQVVQSSGEPGGGISVNIRGVGSINAGNSPLYVVDGLPLDNSTVVSGSGTNFTGMRTPRNPLNSINPNDIASIEVLKMLRQRHIWLGGQWSGFDYNKKREVWCLKVTTMFTPVYRM